MVDSPKSASFTPACWSFDAINKFSGFKSWLIPIYSVNNPGLVKILNGFQYLPDDFFRVFFAIVAQVNDPIK